MKKRIDGAGSSTTRRLRRKLVWGYTAAIIVILMCSVAASFLTMRHFLSASLKESLLMVLDAEIDEATPAYVAWRGGEKTPSGPDDSDPSGETPHTELSEQAFTLAQFWFAADGTLLMGEVHLSPESRETLIESFQGWPYPNRELRTVVVPSADGSRTWHFIAAADEVRRDGESLGKVLVGINLTPILGLTGHYYAICAVTILIVSILAYFIGNSLAARAILPVEEAMERQQHFVADASHELRTPLSILLSSVDMLNGSGDRRALVQGMKEEILGMRNLTNSLLTLARFDGENGGHADFDLSEALRSAVGSMQRVADRKDIRIVPSVADGVRMYGDGAKTGQLIGILLDNAVKYSPENSVVRLDMAVNQDVAEIAVVDRGMGISREHLEHIFDRFYRVDEARRAGGYGLGLSIAQNIAALHGAEIRVESREGEGSTFTVLLPLKNRPQG